MEFYVQNDVAKLMRISVKVNWDIEEDKQKFRHQFFNMIKNWKGELPDLAAVFGKKKMDWLLTQFVTNKTNRFFHNADTFINFVAQSGYRDEPYVDENGEPVSRLTTPLHHAYRQGDINEISALFVIYSRFDVNYTNEDGLTHFHVACEYGFDDVVELFLEHGQDPNLLVPKTNDSLLHSALVWGRTEVARLLLRRGVDPNSVNKDGLTPLLYICRNCAYGCDEINMLFEVCNETQQTVQVDVRDNEGKTPLHLALQFVQEDIEKVAELLLRNGADPNLTDSDGRTALQIICKERHDEELAVRFFKVIDDIQQTVQVNGRDELDRTPLQWAVLNLWPNTVDLLLNRGADLSSFVFPSQSCFEEVYNQSNWIYDTKQLRLASGLLAVVEQLEKREYELNRSDAMTMIKVLAKYELFEESGDPHECRYVDEEFDYLYYEEEDIPFGYGYDEEEDEGRFGYHDYREEEDMPFGYDYNVKEQERRYRAKEVKDFTTLAKNTMVIPTLSLYDLIRLRPEEAAKLLTCLDYYELSRLKSIQELWRFRDYGLHLCEIAARGFFRRWALDPLRKLTCYRLPILCCDMIIEQLMNQDLCNICLSAESQNS